MASKRRSNGGRANRVIGSRGPVQYTMHSRTQTVILLCGHSAILAPPIPTIGDELMCTSCREPTAVASLVEEWRFKCVNCSYARSFGEAEISCKTMATAHRIKRNHHVSIFHGDRVIGAAPGYGEQLSILGVDEHIDPPPF